jgi:hypothetical protein
MENNQVKPMNPHTREKILLALLPFWTSLIPPLGISCLKSFIQKYGYRVKTLDANIKKEFKDLYLRYFNTLKSIVPGPKRGNFFNTGNDVLRSHMMAHPHHTRENQKQYIELVKLFIYQVFFGPVDPGQVSALDKIILEFYTSFKNYFLQILEKTPYIDHIIVGEAETLIPAPITMQHDEDWGF